MPTPQTQFDAYCAEYNDGCITFDELVMQVVRIDGLVEGDVVNYLDLADKIKAECKKWE